MNLIKTFLLMSVLTIILILVGGAIGGEEGLIVAFGIAMMINFIAYWFSAKLAITMTRSRPLAEKDAPEVYRAVRELTQKEGMPMPGIYLMPVDQPNAFAAGRNPKNSVISVTNGLLSMMNYEELKGVLAHELAHIRNRDVLISTVAAVMAGALVFISRMGMWGMMWGGGRRDGGSPILLVVKILALIIAPIAALLIRMAISRTREYQADATAARMTGSPDGLAGALSKMGSLTGRRPVQINEATSHMFIINPLNARGLNALFSTHPPLQDRVNKLKEIR